MKNISNQKNKDYLKNFVKCLTPPPAMLKFVW